MYLHDSEKVGTTKEGKVYVLVETKDFSFEAAAQEDGSVNVYVEWGDDMGGDVSSHKDWADAKRWLDTIINAKVILLKQK